MQADYGLECYTNKWYLHQFLGVLGLLIYPIGWPSFASIIHPLSITNCRSSFMFNAMADYRKESYV